MIRSCYTCDNRTLCYLKRKVQDALNGNDMLNIDGVATPGTWIDIFIALGNACSKYEKLDTKKA